jgi:hypothetical protein
MDGIGCSSVVDAAAAVVVPGSAMILKESKISFMTASSAATDFHSLFFYFLSPSQGQVFYASYSCLALR